MVDAPPPPPGFKLDAPTQNAPTPPPGFKLDGGGSLRPAVPPPSTSPPGRSELITPVTSPGAQPQPLFRMGNSPASIRRQAQETAAALPDMASRTPLMKTVEKGIDEVRGRMPAEQADYDTPVPWEIRAHLAAADPVKGDRERQLVIEKFMPGSQISYDPGGRMMVKPPGSEKFQPVEGGFWSDMGASLVGTIAPNAGAIAGLGAVAPAMTALTATGPMGVVGATALGIAGLFGGAQVGKVIDEVRKDIQGLRDKNLLATFDAMNESGKQAVIGELFGRGIVKGFGALKQYPQVLGEQTAESKYIVEELLARGYRPRVEVATPEASRPGYVQEWVEKTIVSRRHAENAAALEKDILETLGLLGMSRQDAEVEFNKILRGQVDTRVYGEDIAKKVNEYVRAGEESLSDARKAVDTKVNGDLAQLEKSMGDADPATLTNIQTEIDSGRQSVINTYKLQYEGLWKMTGGKAMYDTADLRAAAQELLERLPPTAKAEAKGIARSMGDDAPNPWLDDALSAEEEAILTGGKSGKVERIFTGESQHILETLLKVSRIAPEITPQQAHMFRSALLGMERNADFMRNFGNYGVTRLRTAMEKGFDDLENKVPGFKDKFREVNAGYKNEMGRFDNASIKRLMRDQNLGGAIAPENVMSFMRNPAHFSQIWKVLSPETQQAVRALDFKQMMDAATDPQTLVVDGKKLARQIALRESKVGGEGVGSTMYGRRFSDLKRIANKYAAMDGEIPRSNLKGSGDFVADMERVVRAEDAMRAQLDKTGGWMKELGKEGVIGDRALKMVVEPGQAGESRLLEAERFFVGQRDAEVKALRDQAQNLRRQGRTAEALVKNAEANAEAARPVREIQMAQRYALVKLFSDAAGDGKTIGEVVLNGDLKGAWNKWTDRQKEVLFGPIRREIDDLVRRHESVKKTPGDIAGSLAAGSTKLGGIATLPITGLAMLMDKLYRTPSVLRWFAGTINEQRFYADAGDQMAHEAWRMLRDAPGTATMIVQRAQAQADKDYGAAK